MFFFSNTQIPAMKACEITYHNTNCQKDKRSVTSPGAVIRSWHENLCGMGNNWKENNKPSPGNEQFNDWKENLYNLLRVKKKKSWQSFLNGSHLVSKDEWSFIPFTVPDKYRTSWTGNHSKPPQQVEWMYLFSILCMLVFILLPAEHLSVYRGIQQSCHIKQRTATFLWWGMQRWRGAPRTLHMGWRSGTGHSETLFWATCAKVVKSACREPFTAWVLQSQYQSGGQRARGSSGLSDPPTSCGHKPVWLCVAESCSKSVTLSFSPACHRNQAIAASHSCATQTSPWSLFTSEYAKMQMGVYTPNNLENFTGTIQHMHEYTSFMETDAPNQCACTSSIDLASPGVSQSTSTCPTAALEPHTESITPVQWGHQLRQQA